MENTNPLAQRRFKLEELKRRGYDPYPHKFDYTHTPSDIRRTYDAATAEELKEQNVLVRTCGRIMALRPHGKAGFMDLFDGEQRVQVYARQDKLGDQGFDLFQLLDLGDIVGAEGTLFRTRTNELTVLAAQLFHLSKNLLPLPEKWHGLSDVETRFRQRYVDLIVNKEVRDVFVKRSKIVQEIRSFLDARGYIEVETPVLQAVAGGALARPFRTHHNALDLDLYLRIALELYLKRLIVGDLPRVYELSRIFRNEGISSQHNPEFTMLEFYQAYADYTDLMDLTEALFTELAQSVRGTLRLTWGEHVIDLTPPWRRLGFFDGLSEALGIRVTPETDAASLSRAAEARGVGATEGPPWKLWKEVFEQLVEPTLVQPTFVIDFPVALSPLAKKKRDAPALVDRFELFIGRRELANAYSELNDPIDQLARFREQAQLLARGDDEAHWLDEDYVRALEYGMPPAAGEGIGIDGLVMLFGDLPSIREVILFPHLRPEAGRTGEGDVP